VHGVVKNTKSSREDLLALQIAAAERRGLPISPELTLWSRKREAARRGLLIYPTFRDYVAAANPGGGEQPALLQYEHVPKLVEVGEQIVAGTLTRVLILLPPRYFKTECFGRLLAPYYLLRHPLWSVGLTSYTAHRAWEISEAARDNYQRIGGQLGTAKAVEHWYTEVGGECWAVGMGGAIMGRGYHLGIVDDPIHPRDAKSPVYRERFQRWWPETWLSRQEPVPNDRGQVGQIVLVMQRLGAEDPIDFLFRREVGENVERAPQYWHVVVMDEIASSEPLGRWSGPRGLPPTCTLEPDTRKHGVVLAPSRFTKQQVKEMQRSAGPLVAAAQRQQRPMLPEGDFWNVDWFNTYQELPPNAYNGGKDWDTAYTKETANTASAWVESYRGPAADLDHKDEFDIYIHNVGWDWLEFPELIALMQSLTGPHHVEAKATGKSLVQALSVYGIQAKEVTVRGDKLQRASSVQPVVANGHVWVRAQVIEKLLWGERQGLLRVTAEALQSGSTMTEGLDLNDAFVQALHRHLGIGVKRTSMVFG